SAAGQLTRAPFTVGCSSLVSNPSVSPSAEPLEQRRPALAGCLGSPLMAAPPLPSGVASTPQPTPQEGQVVRTVAPGAGCSQSEVLNSTVINRRPPDNGPWPSARR